MKEHSDMEYYQNRARKERELAKTAANSAVARIHSEMAEHYEKMIRAAAISGVVPSQTSIVR